MTADQADGKYPTPEAERTTVRDALMQPDMLPSLLNSTFGTLEQKNIYVKMRALAVDEFPEYNQVLSLLFYMGSVASGVRASEPGDKASNLWIDVHDVQARQLLTAITLTNYGALIRSIIASGLRPPKDVEMIPFHENMPVADRAFVIVAQRMQADIEDPKSLTLQSVLDTYLEGKLVTMSEIRQFLPLALSSFSTIDEIRASHHRTSGLVQTLLERMANQSRTDTRRPPQTPKTND